MRVEVLFFGLIGLGGPFLGFFVVLAVVSLALRIFMLSTWRRRFKGTGQRRGLRPEEILGRRFARGDIDEDEYQRRLAALRRGTGT
ncbi:MAG: SHOCT domain-containing protein [Candidatus Dormiibacterota bacterium]